MSPSPHLPARHAITIDAFGSRWPAFRVADTSWRALIGIDLERHPGTYPLIAESAGSQVLRATRDLMVVRRQFRERVLKVAPDYVNPPPDLLARIRSEAEFMTTVYEHSASEPAWQGGLRRPVADVANSSFGTRSVFNGEPRSPHAGTDFLSPAGTPIQAPAGGRVVAARELFFTGNTIVIDHGLGVFSMLAHLSRIDVHEGDAVKPGDIVGLVGATGRVTGPHLHWAMRVGTSPGRSALGSRAALPTDPDPRSLIPDPSLIPIDPPPNVRHCRNCSHRRAARRQVGPRAHGRGHGAPWSRRQRGLD